MKHTPIPDCASMCSRAALLRSAGAEDEVDPEGRVDRPREHPDVRRRHLPPAASRGSASAAGRGPRARARISLSEPTAALGTPPLCLDDDAYLS